MVAYGCCIAQLRAGHPSMLCISTVFRDTTVQCCVVVDSQDLTGSRSRQERHMTLQEDHIDVGQRTLPPEHTPRLRLKPKSPQSGHVDGAWWPHSDNLAAELPDLLTVLSVRLGRIDRVMYNLNEWAKASAKLPTGGRRVRLDGYRLQPTNTIDILGLNRGRIVLLVVPSNTDPDIAQEWMMTAAAPKNASTVADLLGIVDGGREPPTACYRPTFRRRVRRFRS
jgi:uncharacterized protein DUF5994